MILLINFPSPTRGIYQFSIKPDNLAAKIKNDKGGEIGSRLLNLLQIITSLLALPIILAVGVLETAFYAITCQGEKATTIMKLTMMGLTTHTLGVIPLSLLLLILPRPWTNAIGQPIGDGVSKVANLWNCNCCKSNGEEGQSAARSDQQYQ